MDKYTFFDREYFEGQRKRLVPPYNRDLVYPHFSFIAKMLKRQIKPTSVLDLGCAKGFLVEAFLDLGIGDVRGIDISEYAINDSSDKVKKYLIVGDVEKEFPFKDNSFDLITSVDLFEHLYNPTSVLKEAYRTLKKNGKMFLIICGFYSPNATKDKSHINIKPLREWGKLIEKEKFKTIYVKIVNCDYMILIEKVVD
jgi:ubiquinone/menaquinone biosynthesis C-methylase UbiE